MVLEDTETVGADTSVTYRTGGSISGDICGAIVDKRSGAGGKTEVYGTAVVKTGPDEPAEYVWIPIRSGQDCWTLGSGAVIYVKYR